MLGSSTRGIFLSYRRDDAGPYARLLQQQLSERFPGVPVFMDVDSIEAGLDFADVIREALESSAVLVTLIGRQWVTFVDEDGNRRLDNRDDYVRFEVEAALERGVRVIPVLIDGASPLRQQQLPFTLHKLARLHALELSYVRFQYDADRLLDLIQRVLEGVGTPAKEFPSTDLVAAPTAAQGFAFHPATSALSQTKGSGRARVARVVAAAKDVALSITEEKNRVDALLQVAEALAVTDPDGAVQLIMDAESSALSITDKDERGYSLFSVVHARVSTDIDHATFLAQSITDKFWRAAATRTVVKELAASDPDHAEHLAQSIADKQHQAEALTIIAAALIATDPTCTARLVSEAENIAQSIINQQKKAEALLSIVDALAASDPDHAEHLAQSIPKKLPKVWALLGVAGTLAATDPDRATRLISNAERIAQSITLERHSAYALAGVVEQLVVIDPDHAERLAQSIPDMILRASALTRVAKALAATDPDRATRLIAYAERLAQCTTDEKQKANLLGDVAEALAVNDPDHAERIAQSIADSQVRVLALLRIAKICDPAPQQVDQQSRFAEREQ